MKPTQQEIIELAREAGFEFDKATKYEPASLLNRAKHDIHAFQRFATLLLERFGAGGGEPVGEILNYVGDVDWISYVPLPKTKLYIHPSPTDLRAEYLRGLEDAAKVCDEISLQANAAWKLAYKPQDQGREMGADECADAIRTLKGK